LISFNNIRIYGSSNSIPVSYTGQNKPLTICNRCGGAVKIIACIEDPSVIKKILKHLDAKSMALASANQLSEPRAPPQAELFD